MYLVNTGLECCKELQTMCEAFHRQCNMYTYTQMDHLSCEIKNETKKRVFIKHVCSAFHIVPAQLLLYDAYTG
jgi:hypothetical protein